MEFSIPVTGDVAILRQLPDDKLIGLGAVECRFDKIDTRDEIVARVEEAMKHVDPERLSISPDCGFSPGLDGVTCRWRSPIRSSRTRRPRRGG